MGVARTLVPVASSSRAVASVPSTLVMHAHARWWMALAKLVLLAMAPIRLVPAVWLTPRAALGTRPRATLAPAMSNPPEHSRSKYSSFELADLDSAHTAHVPAQMPEHAMSQTEQPTSQCTAPSSHAAVPSPHASSE